MEFIDVPNLPQNAVRLAVVDGRISDEVERSFEKLGVAVIRTMRHGGLYEAVSFHPDMFLHHVCHDTIIFAPQTGLGLLEQLSSFGFKLVEGVSQLGPRYPADIAYNVARVGRFYFHNLQYTDPVLREALDRQGLEAINIRQGYARCSISIVDENSIITSDAGIARAAEKKKLEVLLLEPGQGILLPGVECGFIGGASGLVDKKSWVVSGDAHTLTSYSIIRDFLDRKNIDIISLAESNITDIGGIIPLKTI